MVWNSPLVSWSQLSDLYPSQLLHPQPTCWQKCVRSRKCLGSVQALTTNSCTTSVLSTVFPAQMQSIAPYQLLWRKWTPAQAKWAQRVSLCMCWNFYQQWPNIFLPILNISKCRCLNGPHFSNAVAEEDLTGQINFFEDQLSILEELGTITALPALLNVVYTFVPTQEGKEFDPCPLLAWAILRSAAEAAVKAPCIIKGL